MLPSAYLSKCCRQHFLKAKLVGSIISRVVLLEKPILLRTNSSHYQIAPLYKPKKSGALWQAQFERISEIVAQKATYIRKILFKTYYNLDNPNHL